MIEVQLPRLRKAQWRLYDAMQRFNCWVCHRRMGKTVLALEILVAKAAACTLSDPRFAYFAPLREQAKDIAWLYLQRFVEDIPGIEINQAELRIVLPHNQAQVRLYGADNYGLGRSRRGIYLDGVVIDEYADIAPVVWTQVVRPMLTDRLGWAIFIGTPRGKNHFYQLYQRAVERPYWSTALLRADQTQVIAPDELALIYAEALEEGKLADYEQEYLCSWEAPMPGAVYAAQLRRLDAEGRVGVFPPLSNVPMSTAWDIGPAHTAIWWFQQHAGQVRFIDYEEGAGDLGTWITTVQGKPYTYDHAHVQPPLTRTRYEVHYGPHDLEDSPDYATSKTRLGVAREHNFRFTVIPRGAVEDGIEAGRVLMDRAVFDERACERGLNALRSYRYELDDARQTYRTVPRHDWASHGADAFRYAAVGLLPPPQPAAPGPPPGSFASIAQEYDRWRKRGRPMRSYVVGGQ